MKFILGKKIGMSRIFKDEKMIPVSLILAEPCLLIQIKTQDKDGYQAVQIGSGERKKISKSLRGHLNKAGKSIKNIKNIFEFRVKDVKEYKVGKEIKVTLFKEGDKVNISGISKGKGFTGVVKRHGFHGAPATHGHRHDQRAPGSIGSAFPEHVFKGVRMAGRSGYAKSTVKNLEVVKIEENKNLMAVKGSVPGAKNSLLRIEAA